VQQFTFLINSAVLVLLPLVPAIALFKIFPETKAEGEGPLAGIHWKLGGAFSGYVLVALMLFGAMKSIGTSSEVSVWTVRGVVTTGDGDIDPNQLRVRTLPQGLSVERDGQFEFKLIGQGSGDALRLPQLVFDLSLRCFQTRTIAVDGTAAPFAAALGTTTPLKITRDESAREIRIETPIQLKVLPQDPRGTVVAGAEAKPCSPKDL
jgi:hypothetical protein